MTREYIIEKIKKLKPQYEKEGFILVGLFGSIARGDSNSQSDIDLLYKVDPEKFISNHQGFTGFSRILAIKEELKKVFNKEIDLCAINGNSETFKKYALKDAIYV